MVHAGWFQPEPIHHESYLEKACVELLLLMPQARHIQHQPMKLIYEEDGKERTHIPDFKVTLADASFAVVEVKPAKFVKKHRTKFDACAAQLASSGVPYLVCTDKELSADRVARAEALRDMARRLVPGDALNALLDLVRAEGFVKIEEAMDLGIGQNVIGHAVGRRLLTVGPSLEISPPNGLRLMESEDEFLSSSDWLGCPPWRANMEI
jgi:hypothetical protein